MTDFRFLYRFTVWKRERERERERKCACQVKKKIDNFEGIGYRMRERGVLKEKNEAWKKSSEWWNEEMI